MYKFVREELRVPFLRTSMLRTRGLEGSASGREQSGHGDIGRDGADSDSSGLTVGELITSIHQSIRTGALFEPVMACLLEVENTEKNF